MPATPKGVISRKENMPMERKIKESEILECVYTAQEAARAWGIMQSRVSHACTGFKDRGRNSPPRFTPTEARKVGGSWLVTIFGMERVFGRKEEKK